ncbi:MAG: Crp/Fnr family transcriptional regulator [Bacteroidota bacterium]|nr:Crp/Fnr family transcriptional regulator [Bacteroidota bacterium]
MKSISEKDREFVCDIQAPCFQLLTPEEIELVRASKTQILFRKGENLTKQGAFATYIMFVLEGLSKQHIEGEGSRQMNLRIIRPGEFIGLSAVFGKNTFNYSVVALTETKAYIIEKSAMAKLVQQNGMFAYSIIRRYCEHNTLLFDTIRNLTYKQMNGRLADALLYLDSINSGTADVFTLLTRRDIAEFAGISTESTVKLLKAFEKDGIINLDEKRISIKNRDVLMDISKKG